MAEPKKLLATGAFRTPYSPQVNLIERSISNATKKQIEWQLFDNLGWLRQQLSQVLSQLTQSIITSVTEVDFIGNSLFVASI